MYLFYLHVVNTIAHRTKTEGKRGQDRRKTEGETEGKTQVRRERKTNDRGGSPVLHASVEGVATRGTTALAISIYIAAYIQVRYRLIGYARLV
jgi:hypothetical protein